MITKIVFPALLGLASYTQNLHAIEIPLDLGNSNWQILEYKNIPANRVSQIPDGLKINISGSASPLIYVFEKPQTLQEIRVRGKLVGALPLIPEGLQQGEKGADDYAFRIGLVLSGSKTLNFAQKFIAPNWVNTLYNLAPTGGGIEHIQFLNLANPGVKQGEQREHPDSKGLFIETIVNDILPDQNFVLNYTPPEALRVLALWISSDGDDTHSSFTVEINHISYD